MAVFSPVVNLVEVRAPPVSGMGKLTLVQALLVASDRNQPSWFEHGRECVGSSVTEKPRGSRNPGREQTFSAACRSPPRPAWSPVVVQQAGRRLGQSKRRRDRLSWGPVLVPVAVTMVRGMWPRLCMHPRSPGPGSPLKPQTVRAGSGGKSERACEGRWRGRR